jgi:hypothetical protein
MLFKTHLKNQEGKFLLFYIKHTFYLDKDIVTKCTLEKSENRLQTCPLHVSMFL